ncbi:MAG: MBL fold metallo-hydrolase [Porticoccaceae bacterium]
MRFASLGSGSKGNGTLVEWRDTCLLVDCGFSVRETERRLRRLGRRPDELTAILVTHEHGDHIGGVMPLARRYDIAVVMSAGTAQAAGIDGGRNKPRLLDGDREFCVGELGVTPVAVPHNARQPVQYVFRNGRHTLGLLTDLGSITPNVVESYQRCDGLLLEANHDAALLADGIYPPSLKQRVGGPWGHLNNGQAAEFLGSIDRGRLQALVLGHISQQNNLPDLVAAEVAPWIAGVNRVSYACQDQGFSWLILD